MRVKKPSTHRISIRKAREADAAPIGELIAELGYERDPADTCDAIARLQKKQRKGLDLLLVATNEKGDVGGWLQAHASEVLESGFRVELVGLIVSAKMRRLGMGRRLVAAAEQWARTLGAGSLVVRSNVNRKESHSFYPALGFKVAKTQVVYKKPLRRGKWT